MATNVALLCVPALSRAALVAAWGDNTYGQTRLPDGVNNVKAIAAGEYHGLALRSDGSVIAWGLNNEGQTNVPAGLANTKAIAAGGYRSMALKADGTVVVWGDGSFGQTNVPGDLVHVTAIAAGTRHNLALTDSGLVVAWGDNNNGQTNVPAGLSDVTAIAAGSFHSMALKADGTVVSWGGYQGQPNTPPGLSNVVAIAGGFQFSVALKGDGTVVSWGSNYYYNETQLPAGLSNITAIAAGFYHAVALRTDGTAVAWGGNTSGQSAIPSSLLNVTAIACGNDHNLALVLDGPVLAPEGRVQIVQDPESHALPYTSNVTFSVLATGQAPLRYQWYFNGSPMNPNNVRVSGTTNATLTITNLQFSDIGTYAAVVSNAFGAVVSSSATLVVISPPFITQQPVSRTVRAGSDVTISAAANGTPPLRYQWNYNGADLPGATNSWLPFPNVQSSASGIYSLTVTNTYGSTQTISATLSVTDSPPYILQQPYVRRPDQSTTTNPVVLIGGSVTINFSARGSTPLNYQWRFNGVDLPGATNATLALTNLRYDQAGYYTVEVHNAYGSTNSTKLFLNIVQVYVWDTKSGSTSSTPTNVPPGLTNVAAVAAGHYHLLALRSDGRLATWATFANSSISMVTNIPASVTNVSAIAASGFNSMALRSNGTVVVWGENFSGQTNVPANLSNVTAIAAGDSFCLALRSNGTVAAWGNNSVGQASVPGALSNVIAIAAGGIHSLALKANGRVVAWGSGTLGQTNVPAGLTNVIAITAGRAISVALKADGTIVTWGSTDGVLPANLTNLIAFTFGTQSNFGLQSDGGLVSWFNGKALSPTSLSNVISCAASQRDTFSAIVVGNGAPCVLIQPGNQTTARGDPVQFHARAVGVQPLNYQWQFENQDLPEATNADLILPNAQGRDAGRYRVVVANPLGTAVSRTAVLTLPFSTNLAAALNTNNWAWTNSGTTNWFAQIRETHDGDVAAQSGLIGHNQQSILQTVITGPGILTFWWKVSSEAGYDFLRFQLDNAVTPVPAISGETGWEQRTIAISNGNHTLRWTYAKDGSVSAGRDAGWLDEVFFTPAPPVVTIQPASQSVWAGSNASFFAVTLSYFKPVTYQWLRDGTNLAGATNQTLSLTRVGRVNRGAYSVRASNAGGSTLASNATLQVNVPQRLGFLARTADGAVEVLSRDADGGTLLPQDLTVFEAQASTNLMDWEILSNALSLTNGSLRLRDGDAAKLPRRFYRVIER